MAAFPDVHLERPIRNGIQGAAWYSWPSLADHQMHSAFSRLFGPLHAVPRKRSVRGLALVATASLLNFTPTLRLIF